jgi:hypothetical protein
MKIGGTLGQAGKAIKGKVSNEIEHVKASVKDPFGTAKKDVVGAYDTASKAIDRNIPVPGAKEIKDAAKNMGNAGTRTLEEAGPAPIPQSAILRRNATSQYRGTEFGYNPYLTSQGGSLQGMNYNPYREAAQNQASSQASSDYQSLLSGMQQQGPLSASDRMNAAQNFNRQRIIGQLGGAAKYDQAQSQSQFGADQGNLQRSMNVQAANVGAMNDQSKMLADMNLHRTQNLYGAAKEEANLGRKLDAAGIIGRMQGKSGGGGGILDGLYSGMDRYLGNFFS